MEGFNRQIEIYQAENGRYPFIEWLESLQNKVARYKIKASLDRLGTGNFGKCRFVGKGVYELKINYGPGYRVYFGQEKDRIIVLLCGGDKSTQTKDIMRAQAYLESR